MHPIYNDMFNRNMHLLSRVPFTHDPMLSDETQVHDDRRCIALVANGIWNFEPEFFFALAQVVDTASDPLSYVYPHWHHTFLSLRPFYGMQHHHAALDIGPDISLLKKQIKDAVSPYDVVFNRFIPVTTGIAVVGGSDVLNQVNASREILRNQGLVIDERYKNDIIHFTALRWCGGSCFNKDLQEEILQTVANLPVTAYASLRVTSIDIVRASWLMLPQDVEVIDTVHLCALK